MEETKNDLEYGKYHFSRGLDHILNEHWIDAEVELRKSLVYIPNRISTRTNLCAVLIKLKQFDDAKNLIETTLKIDPLNPELIINLGLLSIEEKRFAKALEFSRRAIALKPDYSVAWNNQGVALRLLNRHSESLISYERAIELEPENAELWINRGNALMDLGRHDEAVASYDLAIKLKPENAQAWFSRGSALSDLKQHDEAFSCYERAIKLNPDLDFSLGTLIYNQLTMCNWANVEYLLKVLQEKINSGSKASMPFQVLSFFDFPYLQKLAAEIYVKAKFESTNYLGSIKQFPKKDKIRIGYFSMDFRDHAVSHLIVELIERHDRKKFEIFGFSFGPNTEDLMRKRLEKAFDKFIDVRHLTDFDITRAARDREIDIAIDLGGHTRDSRPQIFTERAAPIQVNYLGYPGTWGHDSMDYIVCDKIVVAPHHQRNFTEKLLVLPNQFQVNQCCRSELNNVATVCPPDLPQDCFVFCCFNNNWKISSTFFKLWASLLQQVPNSILWMYSDNSISENNLKLEALKYGISLNRLIFARRVAREKYFDQYRFADLFLDTLPYNAGTTASDALWVGLPVLTCMGNSFAGRMAASLLTNIGLPELITRSLQEYESLAIELATNPDKLTQIKTKLAENRLTTPLFDTPLFTKHIEAAYQAVYDRYQSGLQPDHIYLITE
jgi:predicted O-linked N-acetylglucosamine transferase (SPINDLY family)